MCECTTWGVGLKGSAWIERIREKVAEEKNSWTREGRRSSTDLKKSCSGQFGRPHIFITVHTFHPLFLIDKETTFNSYAQD